MKDHKDIPDDFHELVKLLVDKLFRGNMSLMARTLEIPFSTVRHYYVHGPSRPSQQTQLKLVIAARWFIQHEGVLQELDWNVESAQNAKQRMYDVLWTECSYTKPTIHVG